MDTTPTSPGEHALVVDGAQLRYRVAGHGPLLVFHPPGWGIGADPYVATLARLEETCTVVYLWPRGSAGSPAPDTADLNVGRFVADLEALRSHLGVERIALAGHSHGGLVALQYALRHPRAVDRLLLLSSQLTGVPMGTYFDDRNLQAWVDEYFAAAMTYLSSRGGFGHLFELRSDEQVKTFLAQILPLYFTDQSAMTPLADALASTTLPYRTLQAVSASDGDYPLDVAALADLTVPVAIAAGRQDRICPLAGSRSLARIVPHSELLVFEASGHFPWLEESDSFFARVREAILRRR